MTGEKHVRIPMSAMFAALAAAVSFCAMADGNSATVAKFVDWIGSTGAQRINTGIVPDKRLVIETDYIAGDYSPYVRQENKALFGTAWNEYLLEQREGLGFRASSTKTKFTTPAEGDECTFTLARDGALCFVVNGNINTEATVNSAYTGSLPLYLFGLANENNRNATFKLRRFSLVKEGVALRYLVPCVDTEDRPGLFDTVSGTIFYDVNESATAFTVPEEDPSRTDVRLNGGTVEVSVAASAGAGATVTGPIGWVALGSTLTFSAEVPAGQHFFKWTDAAGNSYYDNPHAVTVNAPLDLVLTPHFGTTHYVESSDSLDDYGDGSAGSPYSSIKYALAQASDGDLLLLKTGTYTLAEELVVEKGVTIRSASGNKDDVVLTVSGNHRFVRLNHADARLAYVTIGAPGAMTSCGCSGVGVQIGTAGGILDHATVRNLRASSYGTSGGGVFVSASDDALVDSVVVSNCSCYAESGGGGHALYQAGGVVRNSLFIHNDNVSNDAGDGNGGTVKVAGGLFSHCTVACNTNKKSTPGVWASSGAALIRDCVIAGNVDPTKVRTSDHAWYGTASCFVNCVCSTAINDSCFVEDNPFEDLAHENLTPSLTSRAFNGAAQEDWMLGAADVFGNPRVSGENPDIGAVERDATTFSAAFTVANDYGMAPITATFTVKVLNAGAEGVICHWDWNGDGVADYDTEELVCEHQFTDAGASSVRLTVEDKASGRTAVVPVAQTVNAYPRATYVRSDAQATPVYPYDTWEKAATSVADAVAAAGDGSEVFVSNGVYNVSGEILIDRAMKVHGATGNARDVTLKVTSSAGRSVRLQNAGAWIDSMTFTGGNIPLNTTVGNSGYGAGAMIDSQGGTISNCFIHSTKFGYCYSGGGGIYIKGDAGSNALVTDCVVSNCTVNSEGTRGSGLYMSSGTVRNCLFIDNICKSNTKNGTCYVGGGKLVNCTIVRNIANSCAGVWAEGSGIVRNCVIGYNTAETSTDAKHPCWEGTASCFDHCVAGVAINDSCKVEGAGKVFVSAATGDFTLGSGSEAVNGGVYEDWMEGAHDLAGNDRVRGELPDMGAFEADPAVFSASFEADRTQGFYPLTVTFTASAVNAGTAGARFYWDWDCDGTADETTYEPTVTHVFTEPFAGEVRMTAERISDGALYPVPASVAITAAPEVLYVDAACETSKAPYAEPNYAASNVADAVAVAIDGCRVVVAKGDYPVSNELLVDKAIVLSGATGRPEDVRLYRKTATGRIIHLKNSGARVESLTARGGIINMNQSINNVAIGAGIAIDSQGGTVSNCVIHSCKNSNCYSGGSGIGIQADVGATALVTHCVISNCTSDTEGTGGAAVFFKTNVGEVRNSIIVGNKATGTGGKSQNGAVRMGGGRLVNCTLVGNTATLSAGVWGSAGEVVNCIVAGNVSAKAETDPLYAVLSGSADIFSHCVTDVEVNDSCFVASADELFKDLAAGDLRLTRDSPACDKGVKEDWMTGSTDFWGGIRVVRRRPDAGACEYQAVGFSVILR